LGPAVWREVGAQLDQADRFARNGAAEVLQDIGFLDSVVDDVARGAAPEQERVAILEKAFREGGARLAGAVVLRSDTHLYPAVRNLLDRLGFQESAAA